MKAFRLGVFLNYEVTLLLLFKKKGSDSATPL